jgi:hypothetical protein
VCKAANSANFTHQIYVATCLCSEINYDWKRMFVGVKQRLSHRPGERIIGKELTSWLNGVKPFLINKQVLGSSRNVAESSRTKSLTIHIVSQINPFNDFQSRLFAVCFNILPCTPRYSGWSLSFQNLTFPISHLRATYPAYFLLHLAIPIHFWWGIQTMKFLTV